MDEIEKAYLEWMNGIADIAIPERAEEIKLEGRLTCPPRLCQFL